MENSRIAQSSPGEPFTHTFCKIVIIALTAATCADLGRTIYQFFTGTPAVNWSITGRWFSIVFEGRFFIPSIGGETARPAEYVIGLSAYYFVSLIFAAAYVIIVEKFLDRRLGLINGIVFGLVTLFFPLFVQLPSMGQGIMAIHSANPLITIGRTLVHHTSFGLGLGLGALLAQWLLRKSPG